MKHGRQQAGRRVCGEWQVSIRRACAALEFDRSTYHYKTRRSGQAALERWIKEIRQVRVRYGHRRATVRTIRVSSRVGPAVTQQNAEAPGQGQVAR